MNFADALYGGPPPNKLKVYAPNGDTKEILGHLGVRGHQEHKQLTELFLQHADGKIEVLNKKGVVLNMETGIVCYNPRVCPTHHGEYSFITGSEKTWLKANPHWPAILELWDHPVDNAQDGLH